jgi:hypothetical protein
MQIVQAPRASAIIYNLLVSRPDTRPWLLPANICPIVPITFLKARVPFDLVDISEHTLHIDLDPVHELLKTRKFGGFLYAHTYGEPSTPQDFFKNIKMDFPEVFVLDDRCLCIPEAKPVVDTNADLSLYSTGYSKFVELNRGGYAFLKDDVNYQPSKLPFNGKDLEYVKQVYNQAVQDRSMFEYHDSDWLETHSDLPAWYDYCHQIESSFFAAVETRAEINRVYLEKLPREIQLPKEYQNWRFNIRVKDRKKILDAIFEARLFASSHYASLAGIMTEGHAPKAESLAGEVINLFNDRHFTPSQAEKACHVILENLS